MKETRLIMGMPITIEIADPAANAETFEKVFAYFTGIDERFSTYKSTSEITAINEKRLQEKDWSPEMMLIFVMCKETQRATNGYFNIMAPDGKLDPSGIVKGWAIWNAAKFLEKDGFKNFYVDAGGDIQPRGENADGKEWSVGVKNPWNQNENVKTVYVTNEGVATSGTYIRGLHIYNPLNGNKPVDEVVSLTVIGPNIYEADRFATAAFAMGKAGINFIESVPGLEGYLIDKNKVATMTSGFERYTTPHD